MSYKHLVVRREGAVEYVQLNRPEVRNAFNEEVIADLARWARTVRSGDRPRAAVLSGNGKVFCAGADVGWMSRQVGYTRDENVRDATEAARMFLALDSLPIPLIGRLHGAALGGGAGLAAVCDIVVADEQTVFGFTEVKLGILPAIIAPYAIAKIGLAAARELFLTGATFSAARAREIGLIQAAVASDAVAPAIERCLEEILTAGPEAVIAAKALIRRIAGLPPADALSVTTEAIAERRVSAEGQEGLRAFLEKRKPSWVSGGGARDS